MTLTEPQKSKSLMKFAMLLLALVALILIITFNGYNKPKPVADSTNNNQQYSNNETQNIITDQNEYINYKYNLGLSFPGYWKGLKAVEKDTVVEFSLENENKEYVPIFNIGRYSEDELETSPDPKPIVIGTKSGIIAYSMKHSDQNLSEFGDVFASNSYSGLLFDIQNNIIPTFKLIKKGEAFNEKNQFQKDNEFKLIESKVGDIIAGMTINFIKTFDGFDIQPIIENQPSIDNLSIGFSGETTITGTYHNDKVDLQTGFGGQVCFNDLDEESKAKIPSIVWDNETYFCFNNQDLAKELFSPEGSSGIATIVIDDYIINRLSAEVTDMARLVKVISKN